MRAIDLFSGCGGLSLGLEKAGFNVVGAYENWQPAITIYEQNFRHPVFNIDLRSDQIAIESIKELEPEIITGGPPCQDFSSAGKRNENLGRADLTISYARIVSNILPKWFLMENVDMALKSSAYKKAKQILAKNYGLTEIILDASFYGVPQKRKRLFLIGKLGEKEDFLRAKILGGISKESLTIKKYLGNRIDTEFYYRHPRSYSRRGIFSINEPSPTIRGVNRPIPPDYQFHEGDAIKDLSLVRPLTTQERALIQTFPARFKWNGITKSILEQIIGNAVPVKLAEFVGKCIMEYESNKRNIYTQALVADAI